MAACGSDFTVAVTEDGELLAWGDGRDGHLGLDAVLHQQQPARAGGPELFGNQRIRLAAAGDRHLAVVAEDGAVYTCGVGGNGQLGLGDEQPRRRLTRVPQALFAGSRVVMISCGDTHTMAVTAVGHAWTCGSNVFGQLGVGDTADRLGFTQVDAGQLGGARIVMASCGCYHSVVVSAEGRVFTFGNGMFGCLGDNDEHDRLVPTLLAAEVFEGSLIVTVAAGGYHTMAVGVNGRLWAWGWGIHGQLGLGDTNKRLVPTLVGAEEVFGGSKVRTIACGNVHTLAVTEAGELWAWGLGAQGRLGLNDVQGRLVPTRVDPQHFAHAPISAVAVGDSHSAAVTAGGALYTWGKGEAGHTGSQVPGGLGHADLANRLVPTLVPRQLLGGVRVGRCHGLREELALAFAMGTHERLGASSAAAGGGGGKRRSRRAQGKAPAAGREQKGCLYLMMPAELVKRVVEACGWRAEGELGEGVVRLMGGRRTRVED
jgi:alpha-tubulin suppressor-like RCC1 family protein